MGFEIRESSLECSLSRSSTKKNLWVQKKPLFVRFVHSSRFWESEYGELTIFKCLYMTFLKDQDHRSGVAFQL